MRVVVQRCSRAEVRIDGDTVGRIEKGFLLLVGITDTDSREQADVLAKKIAQLRVFEDADGKMNLALNEVGGAILSISQFTLYADCRKGNRPSFVEAGSPDKANALYEYIIDRCRKSVPVVEKGSFGAGERGLSADPDGGTQGGRAGNSVLGNAGGRSGKRNGGSHRRSYPQPLYQGTAGGLR